MWEGAGKDPRHIGGVNRAAVAVPAVRPLQGAAARPGSSPRHRRGAGAAGARACRRGADRPGRCTGHPTGRAGRGGRMSCRRVKPTLLYAAQIDLCPHPRPAGLMTIDCIFLLRLPLALQKRWEHWEQWEQIQKPVFVQWFARVILFPLPPNLFPLFVGTNGQNPGFRPFRGSNWPQVTPNQSLQSKPSRMPGASKKNRPGLAAPGSLALH